MTNTITNIMTDNVEKTIELLRERVKEERDIILSNHFSIEDYNHSHKAMATLSYLDLSQMDLSDIDFSNLAFIGVNFSDCILRKAVFKNCVLVNCTFNYANLSTVNFENAVIEFCNFYNADMVYTNFSRTSVSECNFTLVDFMHSCFTDSLFVNNNIRASLFVCVVNRPYIPLACPEEGEFIGWKKVRSNNGGFYSEYLVKLKIPNDAKRSSATTNKCRCDKAEVLSIQKIEYDESMNYKLTDFVDSVINYNFRTTIYKIGETVLPDSFDEDRFNECSHGIHFFMNKQYAIDYEI